MYCTACSVFRLYWNVWYTALAEYPEIVPGWYIYSKGCLFRLCHLRCYMTFLSVVFQLHYKHRSNQRKKRFIHLVVLPVMENLWGLWWQLPHHLFWTPVAEKLMLAYFLYIFFLKVRSFELEKCHTTFTNFNVRSGVHQNCKVANVFFLISFFHVKSKLHGGYLHDIVMDGMLLMMYHWCFLSAKHCL